MMFSRKKPSAALWVLVLACCCIAAPVFGQNLRSFNYSVEQGLPSSETYHVMQDSKGFIWISTDRGAVRYNGYEFRVFTTNDGLPTNTVFKTVEDELGRIWFLGFHRSLAYYENGRVVAYRHNQVLERAIRLNPDPKSLYASRNGDVYISYNRQGILHVFPDGRYERVFLPDTSQPAVYFSVRIKGHDLFGQWQGKQSPRSVSMYVSNGRYDTLVKTGENAISNSTFLRCMDGTVYAGTSYCWVSMTKTGSVKTHRSGLMVTALYEDRDSCIWVGAFGRGVRRLKPHSFVHDDYSFDLLGNLSVTGILQDAEGGYWFATLENGVYYFPQFNCLPVSTPCSGLGLEVTAIARMGQRVYAGYNNGLVEEIADGSYLRSFSLNHRNSPYTIVYDLACDTGRQQTWCSVSNGFWLIDRDKIPARIGKQVSRSVYVNRQGLKYFSVDNYLYVYDREPVPLTGAAHKLYIEKICSRHQNEVLLATLDGLFSYRPGSAAPVRMPGPLGRVRVKDLRCSAGGRLVCATLGKGIFIEKNGRQLLVDEKAGLASNFVNAVDLQGDTIWAATTKGVSRLILHGDRIQINNFDQYNGLPTNEIKKICVQGDRIWLGTKNGLFWFRSGHITINKKGPVVFLDEIKVNDKPVTGQSRFAPGENNIVFSFFAINYKKRGHINYRYRLPGSDSTWRYTQQRTVQYLSLPPGHYTFEVQAQNEDGYWSPVSAGFGFDILRPFYLEWWFIALAVLLLSAIVVFAVRRRIGIIQHNNRVQLLMSEYKSMALASQINPHFIFNSLNSIQSFIIYEDRVAASDYLSAFARLMRKSLEHSRLDFVQLKEEVELLEMYLALEQLRFKNKFSHRFNIQPAVLEAGLFIPTMILQPFIENSIKHGLNPLEDHDGLVSISLFFEGMLLRCEIDDNGKGRPASSTKNRETPTHTSYGIDITVERIRNYCRQEKMKFYFDIHDKYNAQGQPAGTLVRFYLPYRKTKP